MGNRAAIAAAAAMMLIAGCQKQEPAAPPASAAKSTAPLRVVVIDDSALADSLNKVSGEWRAQSGTDLEIRKLTARDALTADTLNCDAVIYPLGLLGTLAERRLIRPQNAAWLTGDPLDSADLLVRPDAPELEWDGQRYAVPLAEPALVLAYRADLFKRAKKEPPRTWEEYQQLAEFFSDRSKLLAAAKQGAENSSLELPADWSGALEPLAPPWAGRTLLARAAAYAKHRDYLSVLFDRETMSPLIAGPPYVKALNELSAAAKSANVDLTKLSPADTVRLLVEGHAAMAIGWPPAAVDSQAKLNQAKDRPGSLTQVAFAELPGAAKAYNLGHQQWEDRRENEQQRVTLRGVAGMVGSVARGSDRAPDAFGLLVWLASKRWSVEVLSASSVAAPLRQSQIDDASSYAGTDRASSIAKHYGEVLAAALKRQETMAMPRVGGEEQYMAALDDAVLAAVKKQEPAQQALDEAGAKWQNITDRLGRAHQIDAYRHSMAPTR